MKKIIHFSRMTIVCLVIFFLSICGIAACIIRINAYHHARPLTYFSEGRLEPGKYVSGTITSYVVSPRWPKGPDVNYSIYSFGNHYNLIGEEYVGYIVPFNDEQYIRIWIKDQESLAFLRESRDGLHVNVPFVGQIKEEDVAYSYTDDQLGFDHDKVITNYVIFQKSLSTEKFWIKVCLSGIMLSLLLYWFKGRSEVSEVVYENKDSQRIPCYTDISVEIVIAEKRISMYDKLEKEYRNWGCIGAVCIIIGVFLFVKFGSFSALVISILLTGYGIRQLWTYFINSKNSLAIFIANLFDLRTLQIKRLEDYKLLENLRNREDI
ncbi:MAG: hypothetical protein K2N81_02365 [Acetatifactor sp.]|nr:hypothetical protein [Acetatifactor sp.]